LTGYAFTREKRMKKKTGWQTRKGKWNEGLENEMEKQFTMNVSVWSEKMQYLNCLVLIMPPKW
jgi:hypothetical protein